MRKTHRFKVNFLTGRVATLGWLCAFFLTGSIVGCAVAGLLRPETSGALLTHLDRYFEAMQHGTGCVQGFSLFWRTVRTPLAAFLLGLTAMGVVGLPVLFVVRGFCLSYAISVFYRLLGVRGLALSVGLFGVSALVWLPAMFELGVTGLCNSYGLLRRVTGNGRFPLPLSAGGYWRRCAICAGMVLVCVGAEYAVVPALVELILRVFSH